MSITDRRLPDGFPKLGLVIPPSEEVQAAEVGYEAVLGLIGSGDFRVAITPGEEPLK